MASRLRILFSHSALWKHSADFAVLDACEPEQKERVLSLQISYLQHLNTFLGKGEQLLTD